MSLNKTTAKRQPLSVVLTVEDHQAIALIASKEDRTKSNMACLLIKEALKARAQKATQTND